MQKTWLWNFYFYFFDYETFLSNFLGRSFWPDFYTLLCNCIYVEKRRFFLCSAIWSLINPLHPMDYSSRLWNPFWHCKTQFWIHGTLQKRSLNLHSTFKVIHANWTWFCCLSNLFLFQWLFRINCLENKSFQTFQYWKVNF